MSKNNKLIPELRFPEFVNEGKWKEISIETIGDVVTGGTPSKEKSEYWGGDFVWVTAQDFKEKYIYNSVLKLTDKGKEKSRVIPKNSVLVTCIASIGLNGINKVECATNQQINSIVCNASNHYEFVYYAISRNITRLKNLAGQTAVPIISKSVFEKFTIQKPNLSIEQQKIAACLSSLDEVIEAHNQKLELLKAHKKGLMQNLFPQEGEKVPKLRFKEFKGEWENLNLSKVSDVIMGSSPSSASYNEDKIGLPLLQGNTDIKNRLSAPRIYTTEITKECEVGDILLSVRAPVGTVAKSLHNACIGRGMSAIRAKKTNSQEYLYQWLFSYESSWEKISQGGTFDAVNSDDIRNLLVPMPKPTEQQKIASCLSALDELITVQAEKIEQLKQHKKGLMQGLFPKMND
ncbi:MULTISPECIES: restriction endonuclease subunit S [unclassified Empedobacter]|uniref:restriction endonuclease subunit S n=1 Tax=unclassified Empedobacter TaxID=2643773 RepID=UPI0025C3DBAF|nr:MULTISPECIES: restriction endonuclease subunit S [unclassified Empedobacter]